MNLSLNFYCLYSYWKRLWRWTTSESLTTDELATAIDNKEVKQGLREGLESYKPLKANTFSQLQSKHSDQTKLLNVVNTLQNYIVSTNFTFMFHP